MFFDQPAHQVGGVDLVDAVAEPAFEAVPVQQRHEELKVGLLAVVRGGREQEEVPAEAGEELAKLVAFGLLDLAAEVGG